MTNGEMRAADDYTINTLGVPALTLMGRAGAALADAAERLCKTGNIVCVCGGGNNGGDGFVCARLLRAQGKTVAVWFVGDKMSAECAENEKKYRAQGGGFTDGLQGASLVVDCLFGTGFHGVPTGKYAAAIEAIRAAKNAGAKVLSADIPSGVNGDNGAATLAVQADETLCIGERKAGVYLGDGLDHAGKITRADIGIALPESSYARLLDDDGIRALLPRRKRNTHKGSFGKAAIVAGSREYTGAAYLATASCLRSGAGYTTLFLPENLRQAFLLQCPEALLESINDGDRVAFNAKNFQKLLAYDAVAYGMGTGVSASVAAGAAYLITHYTGRLILDADALNSLAEYESPALFSKRKCDVVLTPHVKEFSRLSSMPTTEILQDGLAPAKSFAEQYKVTVLLKNAVTVVTDGNRTSLNAAGTPAQAKAGSGDVLSGVIAGLCATGLSAYDGACAGAYIAGKAAELAAAETGEYSMLASDAIAKLGAAFLTVLA